MSSILRLLDPGPGERADIEGLARRCDGADGTSTDVSYDRYLNYRPELPSWYLARRADGGLEGWLSIFAPEAETAEIRAAVDPGSRRRGVFSALIAAAEEELGRFGYRSLLFLRDAASAPGGAVVELLRARSGAELDHREFAMTLADPGTRTRAAAALGPAAAAPPPTAARVARAGPGDLGELAALSAGAFGEAVEESERFLRSTFANPARSVLAARAGPGGSILGMVSVFAEAGGVASINSLVVAPSGRRRGIGSLLLDEGVRAALDAGAREVGLEVDAENRGALGIYLRRGFRVVSEIEYWRVGL